MMYINLCLVCFQFLKDKKTIQRNFLVHLKNKKTIFDEYINEGNTDHFSWSKKQKSVITI